MITRSRFLFIFFLIGTVLDVSALTAQNHSANASNQQSVEEVVATAKMVVAGGYHTCAITDSDSVKCWGSNVKGQLGNGTYISSSVPVDVIGLPTGIRHIALAGFSTSVVTDTGLVYWFGEGSTTPNLNSYVNNVAQVVMGNAHTCVLTNDNSVKCWGDNQDGQLGDGNIPTDSYLPVTPIGLESQVTSLSAGHYYSCATTESGSVLCWGNSFGAHPVPTQIPGLDSGYVATALGAAHACALSVTGTVKCWGQNYLNQLGNGNNENSALPVNVLLNANATSISSYLYHTCVTTSTGGAKCWGWSTSGELGNNSTELTTVPVDVITINPGISKIITGHSLSCVITTNQSVKCWGYNDDGQLGNGTTNSTLTPTNVVGFGGMSCTDMNDADGDGLPNGWEVCGFYLDGIVDGTPDVDLPALGADWQHKDVFLEIDYMDAGLITNIRPNADSVKIMVEAFDNAPIQNIDGYSGIHLHVDYGNNAPLTWGTASSWGNLSEATEIPYQNYLVRFDIPNDTADWSVYQQVMHLQFTEARSHVFHYQIHTGLTDRDTLRILGVSNNIPGQFSTVNRYDIGYLPLHIQRSPQSVAGTSMHELGHNLGLHHGGTDDRQYKPNYLSIMNYSFTNGGLVINNKDGNYNFSIFNDINPLVEYELNELVGITSSSGEPINSYKTFYYSGYAEPENIDDHRIPAYVGQQIDWDNDGTFENVAANSVNYNDNYLEVLESSNDWENIQFLSDNGASCIGQVICNYNQAKTTFVGNPFVTDLMEDAFPDISLPHSLSMSMNYWFEVDDTDITSTVPVTITNSGTNVSTIEISYITTSTTFTTSALPTSIILEPGASYVLDIGLDTVGKIIGHEELIVKTTVQENTNWTGETHVEVHKQLKYVYLPIIQK